MVYADTADSRAEMIATVTARCQSCVQDKDRTWPIEWNRTINSSLGGAAAGASFGSSTGFLECRRNGSCI
jgi:hypothetical protein